MARRTILISPLTLISLLFVSGVLCQKSRHCEENGLGIINLRSKNYEAQTQIQIQDMNMIGYGDKSIFRKQRYYTFEDTFFS